MKSKILGVLFLFAAFATSASYGGEQPQGVAGVDVFIKQNPSKRATTDARGNFDFAGLASGSYTLTFRAKKAEDFRTTTTQKVTVATSYSIRIDGTKRSVNQSGLNSDKLIDGVDIPVELGSGAKIRGQVVAAGLKKMVWIAPEVGSHMPGQWVAEDSKEAAAWHNTVRVSRDDVRNYLQR